MRHSQTHQLQTLLEQGFPVLPGFIVSADSCRAFFLHNNLWHRLELLIKRARLDDAQDLLMVATTIQKLIAQSPLPPAVSDELLGNFAQFGNDPMIITANTLPLCSLGIVGEANAILEIRSFWAKMYDIQTIQQLATSPDALPPVMAISVQRQPHIITSGFLFTSDAINNRKHDCRVEAVWGEGAFSGNLTGADSYWIHRQTGQEQEHLLVPQHEEVRSHHGVMEITQVSSELQTRRKLSTALEKECALLANKLQQTLFFPQKALWLSDGKHLFLAQTMNDPQNSATHVPSHPEGERVLLKGVGQTPGIVTGRVRILRNPHDVRHIGHGDIVVVTEASHIQPELLKRVRGLLIEEENILESTLSRIAASGVALISGVVDATNLLEPDTFVTLHTPSGEVLSGGYRTTTTPASPPTKQPAAAVFPLDAVIQGTAIIQSLGHHPLKLLQEGRSRVLTERVIQSIPTDQYLYRFSDFSTAAYSHLTGGEAMEMERENNPLLGLHGSARLLAQPELLSAEFTALKKVSRSLHGPLFLILPTVRAPHELGSWHRLLSSNGFERSAALRYIAEVATPASAMTIGELVSYGLDGVMINVDHLHHLLLGTDPTREDALYPFDETNGALIQLLTTTLTALLELGVPTSIYGTLAASDAILSVGLQLNVQQFFVPKQQVTMTEERILSLT